ncbi:hypothetical protein ADK61_12490, partial [Streptomyces sp. XY66]
LYDDYVQLVVPAGSPVQSARDLRGKRGAIGQPGSGVRLGTERLLPPGGLRPRPGPPPVSLRNRPLPPRPPDPGWPVAPRFPRRSRADCTGDPAGTTSCT